MSWEPEDFERDDEDEIDEDTDTTAEEAAALAQAAEPITEEPDLTVIAGAIARGEDATEPLRRWTAFHAGARHSKGDVKKQLEAAVRAAAGKGGAAVWKRCAGRHGTQIDDVFKEAAQQRTQQTRTEDGEQLGEMNERYFVINWVGKTLIGSLPYDPRRRRHRLQLQSIGDFKSWLLNKARVGKKALADWWLRHPGRRQYSGVIFAPGEATVPGYLNLWLGWPFEPAPGDCSLWVAMVRDVICSGNEEHFAYVMAWCADAVQHPCERPGVALCLLGKQGAGKGTFARELGALFGEHFIHLRNAQHLVGHFNGHLVNVQLVFADEALFPGDKAGEGALKGLLTEPTIPIEFKNKDVVQLENHVRCVMASNNEWFVQAALDDRRHCVIEVSEARAGDREYFGKIKAQMEHHGGRAALLDLLLKYDLTRVDLTKIPETAARHEQQVRSMDPFRAFWFNRLTSVGAWATEVQAVEVMTDYRDSAGRYPMHEATFGMSLKKLFPSARKVRLRVDQESERRVYCYRLPELARARREFERAVGRKFDWAAYEVPDEDNGLAPL